MTHGPATATAWSLHTKHLVIDARCIGLQPTGVGLCAMRQLQALDGSVAPGWKLSALRYAPSRDGALRAEWERLANTAVIDCAIAPSQHPANEWWTHTALPKLLRNLGTDVLYSPAFAGPFRRIAPRQILMIHDDLVWSEPAGYRARFRAYLKVAMRLSVGAPDAVIFPSADAMARVAKRLPLGKRGCAVWSPIDAARYRAEATRQRIVLVVGSAEPRKNLAIAVKAARRTAGCEVKILGYCGSEFPAEEVLPSLSEDAVGGAFATAAAVVVPSRAEGFGYGVVQALAARAPLVCSDIPVFRELVEGCARFVPPNDAQGWEAAIAQATDPANAETRDLVKVGEHRAEAFAPKAFAEAFWRLC